ncbi:hypothetical protein Cgig2_005282 [Carnegiea gigantea]|uniref:Uncharacterized protein n=1 Tax=Carnegiea gigantea TaxID=171969 RepID=A0A9Q1GWM2_9CARY|nr:hypothetical protein Cgig2_005282 [Carnegiea gigantea]
MGCIAAVECYSLMLGEYNVELTNSRKLVVKLGQQSYTCRLVHPMETHDMGMVDAKMGRVVGEDELDDDYDSCILPPHQWETARYSSTLPSVPKMRPMFTMVNHAVEVVHPWKTDRLKLCCFGIPIILPSQLMRPMFTMVDHAVEVVHLWKTDRLKLCCFDILIILPLQLREQIPTLVYV